MRRGVWVSILISAFSMIRVAFGENAAKPAPEVSASPAPETPGKSVSTEVESTQPKATAVGVKAADPSQNGKPGSTTSLSIQNASSAGVGLQFHFGGPKAAHDPAAEDEIENEDDK